ncbi:MAG TPA: LamG-like jellyroll fold domain-containing protein, partial [Luteolibacter sp.]|nr:LamG-like jellyroll fold domain-containing protein [Luteolibacter sp.]
MLDEARIHLLLEAYIDQTLSADERVELEMLLESSDEARRMFWERLRQHAAAREWAFRSSAERMVTGTGSTKRKVIAFSKGRWIAAATGIAAVIMLLLASGVFDRPPSQTAGEDLKKPVALLALAADADWEGVTLSSGSPMYAGDFRLLRGTARIDFLSGAQMTVRAPAEVGLVDEMKAELHSGIVRVFAPPAATGFTIVAEDLIAVDRGTEFGMMEDPNHGAALHVFTGRVQVADSRKPDHFQEVTGGHAVKSNAGELVYFNADPGLFPGSGDLADEMRREQAKRHSGWLEKSADFHRTRGLVIHYTFDQRVPGDENQVQNMAGSAQPQTNGTVIGSEIVAGRWEGKSACSFSRSTDRVRFVVPGKYDDLTLMAWVRVDRLPNHLNVLLRADEVTLGSPHWQFDSSGRLRFGVLTDEKIHLKPGTDEITDWDVAVSPPLLDSKLGQWVHVASVYDSQRAMIEHFMDGRK